MLFGGTSGVSVLALFALVPLFQGCPVPPPAEPREPQELRPSPAQAQDEATAEPGEEGPSDHWLDAYGAYFTPAQRRAYLATPPAARLDRFGLLLLDIRLREDLLAQSRDVLIGDDVETFRRQPNVAAARAFVEERRRRAAERVPRDERGPPDDPGPRPEPTPSQEPPKAAPPATPGRPRRALPNSPSVPRRPTAR